MKRSKRNCQNAIDDILLLIRTGRVDMAVTVLEGFIYFLDELPALPPAGPGRSAVLDAIAATIAATFGPQVARFVAAKLDEQAAELEHGTWR